MRERNPYCSGFRMDRPIRAATDNVVSFVQQDEYSPTPPPIASFFLLLDGANFLLMDTSDFLLL